MTFFEKMAITGIFTVAIMVTGQWFSGWLEADAIAPPLLSECAPLTEEARGVISNVEGWEICTTIRMIK